MLKYIKVIESNKDLAIELQAETFTHERSPKQIEQGIKTGNPINYIVYDDLIEMEWDTRNIFDERQDRR